MRRVTLEFSDAQYAWLKAEAKRTRCSMSAVTRELFEREMAKEGATPTVELRIPLFKSGIPDLASRVDDYLEGLGEDR